MSPDVCDHDVCEQMEGKLIQGTRPGDDSELARHIGSCLRCFRTASEMRDVPALTTLLRVEAPEDPGPAFWARFPTNVAHAWEASRARPSTSMVARLRDMFRLQLPAALAGACVAAMLMIVASSHRERTKVDVVAATRATPVVAMAVTQDDRPNDGAEILLADDYPIEAQSTATLMQLTQQLATEAGVVLRTAVDENESSLNPVEEVELLGTDDLRTVVQALRGTGGRI